MSRAKKQKPLNRILRNALRIIIKSLFILLLLSLVQVILLRYINPPFTARMAWEWLQSTVGTKHYLRPVYRWQSLGSISPCMIKAVQAGEDQRFLTHHGFDFTEINEALREIVTSGRVRGASTISMQVARTVFLWPGRSWVRKGAEAYYTLLLELLWSKARIIEVYLNTVDWGQGVMGVEAAARKYFRRKSSEITAPQAALLAAILPSPHKWSPIRPNERVKRRQKRILKDMDKMPMI
ncbi:monofunctional biosynthetic peptidoglycan transglycosylase [Thermodesulfobacteriota bacterium]